MLFEELVSCALVHGVTRDLLTAGMVLAGLFVGVFALGVRTGIGICQDDIRELRRQHNALRNIEAHLGKGSRE